MSRIVRIHAREIIDSRGNPTVEADVELASGAHGRAAVPSGASTGKREAVELRDGDRQRYLGKGVTRAVAHVNGEIAGALADHALASMADLAAVDARMRELDGTANKARLGANAVLAVSLAAAHALGTHDRRGLHELLAEQDPQARSMPVPMMNILNGGAHADNSVDIQEFMIVPVGVERFAEALRAGAEVFHALKAVLHGRGLSTAVGDEGGFAPDLPSNEAALETILEAIDKAGYAAGRDIYLGLDVASSELYRDGAYELASENRRFEAAGFCEYLEGLVARYPIVTIEDGMAEEDWDGWQLLSQRLASKVQLVGDDLFVTNTEILREGIDRGIANSILIKPNQIGTLTETLSAIAMAGDAGYSAVVSHRSGETEDASIADIAVGSRATQIKTGSLCRSDRTAKYNQLLRIEEALGASARYMGREAFPITL